MSAVRRGELLPLLEGQRGSGAAGRGRGSGGRWWRHQCRPFGLVVRGNRGVIVE
jgi:hypothetical protein